MQTFAVICPQDLSSSYGRGNHNNRCDLLASLKPETGDEEQLALIRSTGHIFRPFWEHTCSIPASAYAYPFPPPHSKSMWNGFHLVKESWYPLRVHMMSILYLKLWRDAFAYIWLYFDLLYIDVSQFPVLLPFLRSLALWISCGRWLCTQQCGAIQFALQTWHDLTRSDYPVGFDIDFWIWLGYSRALQICSQLGVTCQVTSLCSLGPQMPKES